MTENASRLRTVKVVHTAAWTFFASCVIGIPFAAWFHRFPLAALLIGFVALESRVPPWASNR